MLRTFGRHLRGQWMGATALLLVLSGGTAYAVTQLDANSVESKHIVNGQVKAADLADNAFAAFQTKGSEGWTAATLNDGGNGSNYCNWTNLGQPHSNAAYFRDQDGIVHLQGLVKANNSFFLCGEDPVADRVITTLPIGYRPSGRSVFAVTANNKPGRVDVTPEGTVRIEEGYPSYDDAYAGVSLDGISFRCAPAGQNGCP